MQSHSLADDLAPIGRKLDTAVRWLGRHPIVALIFGGWSLAASYQATVVAGTVVGGLLAATRRARAPSPAAARWHAACAYADLAGPAVIGERKERGMFNQTRVVQVELKPERRGPQLVDHAQDGNVERLKVQLTEGLDLGALERGADKLRVAYQARRLTVKADPVNGAVAHVEIIRGADPLAAREPVPWTAPTGPITITGGIPIGIDATGEPVVLKLVNRHGGLVVAGQSGAGKSNLANVVMAACAFDAKCRILAVDAKAGIEFGPWRPVLDRLATTPAEALPLLRDARAELDRRLAALDGRKHVDYRDGVLVVIVDELAELTQDPDVKRRDEAIEHLRSLAARGRAAGVVTIVCSQVVTVDVLPSRIRDNFGTRVAFRTATPTASDVVLGAGLAAQGFDASTITGDQRGVCLVLDGSAEPIGCRTYRFPDDDVADLVRRAVSVRQGAPQAEPLPDALVASAAPAGAPGAATERREPKPTKTSALEEAQRRIVAVLPAASRADALRAAGFDAKHSTARRAWDALVKAGRIRETPGVGWQAVAPDPAPVGSGSDTGPGTDPGTADGTVTGRTRHLALAPYEPPAQVRPSSNGDNGHH